MKSLFFVAVIALIAVSAANAQLPGLQWAKSFGGVSTQETVFSNSIAVDAAGNIYTIGKIKNGTADLDPGPGTFNLTFNVAGGIFISKLDAAGNFVWAVEFGDATATTSYPLAIALDGAGNVYSTGSFLGTGDFDPGAGVVNLTSAGMEDIFISKLDAAGNFAWAKRIGGSQSDAGTSIAVDAGGTVYATGWYSGPAGPVDFDPGTGTFNLAPNGCPSCVHFGAYVLKLDTDGNFVWADQLGAGIGDATGNQIAIDASGNVYTTGVFNWLSGDFDPGPGTFTLGDATTNYKTFVSKLDASGNFVWAKGFYGPLNFTNPNPNGIKVDGLGNVITAGYFTGTIDFDPGAGTYNLTPADVSRDAYISKLDASGNFLWAVSFGRASSPDEVNSISLDASGNVYSIGQFYGTVDFDPGIGVFNLTAQVSSIDTYISKLDAAGNFLWAYDVAKTIDSFGANEHSIASDNSGNLYATGLYFGSTDFDPGAGVFTITPTSADLFVIKLGAPTAPSITITTQPTPVTVCDGINATFTTAATGTTNISYQWQLSSTLTGTYNDINNGGSYSNATTLALTIATIGNFGAGFYRCKINGDLATAVFTSAAQLVVNLIPVAPTTVGANACNGTTATLSASGGTNGQYKWYTLASGGTAISGAVNSSYVTPAIIATTIYYVTLSNAGCESTRTPVTATLISTGCPSPPPVITATPLSAPIEGKVIVNLIPLIATSGTLNLNSLKVTIPPSSGATTSITSGVLTIDYSGRLFSGNETITIEACDISGPCSQKQFDITVAGEIVVYNAISPNGDGKNDFFFLQYIESLPSTSTNQVIIFNRWGDEVFSVSDYNNSTRAFAGLGNSGSKLPSGTYFYKINLPKVSKTLTGFLELK